jgi:branched-chain amino acid transport system substrate-binding protein
MKSKSLSSAVFILLTFFWVVAFALSAHSAATAAPTDVLKVGVPNAYTGSGASSGIPTLKAYKIQAEILKQNGGFSVGGKRYNIDLVQADDGYTAAGGKAAAEKLIFADKIKFFLGPLSSAAMMGMLPVVEENKIICMTNSITTEKFKTGCRYIFQVNPQGGLVLASQVMRIIETNNVKNVAAFSPNDETGRQNWEQMKTGVKRIWEKYGADRVKIVFEGSGERMQSDYTPILAKMLATKPDFIVLGAFAGEAPLIVKQCRELGYKGAFANPMSPDQKELAQVAGPQNVYEYHSWGIVWDNLPKIEVPPKHAGLYKRLTDKFGKEPLAEFYKRYKGAYQEDPPGAIVYMPDNMPLLVLALEEANSFDADKIVKVMESWEVWPSYYGTGIWSGEKSTYGIKHVATKSSPTFKQEGTKMISTGFVMPEPVP